MVERNKIKILLSQSMRVTPPNGSAAVRQVSAGCATQVTEQTGDQQNVDDADHHDDQDERHSDGVVSRVDAVVPALGRVRRPDVVERATTVSVCALGVVDRRRAVLV